MKQDRVQTQKHNVIVAESNILFRRGLCSLLSAESDFAVVAEAGTEAELLVALERHRADAIIVTTAFLAPTGIFATTRSDTVRLTTPVVALVPDPAVESFPPALIEVALTVPRRQATVSLVKELRRLLRPDLAAQKQADPSRKGGGLPALQWLNRSRGSL